MLTMHRKLSGVKTANLGIQMPVLQNICCQTIFSAVKERKRNLIKVDFVKERAARRGGSGSLVHIKEVDVLLAGWKDNVQPLAGSTPVPRKFRR